MEKSNSGFEENWISDREKALKNLKNDISEKTIDSKQDRFSALEKIEEEELKLHQYKTQYHNKNDSPNQNIVKFAETLQNKGYQKCKSNFDVESSHRNTYSHCENTENIDHKISQLMNKYKDGDIDNLEDELVHLKRTIMNQIQYQPETIRTDENDTGNIKFRNSGKVNKSMRKLQETLSLKEHIDLERINTLSIRNEDMKETIRELIKKIEELEEINSGKSRKMAENEMELNSMSKEIMFLKEKNSETKEREERLLRSEGELQQEVVHLKTKISEKKNLSSEIMDLNVHIQKLNTEIRDKDLQINSGKTEIFELLKRLEEKEKYIIEIEYHNSEFEKSIGEYQERLFDCQQELTNEFNKNKEFVENNRDLLKNIEELNGKASNFESKYLKFKGKFEEELERNAIFSQENHGLLTAREAIDQDFHSLKLLLDEERREGNDKSLYIEKMRSQWDQDKDKIEKLNSNLEYLRDCILKEQEDNTLKEQTISKMSKKLAKIQDELANTSMNLKQADYDISELSAKLQETLDSEKEMKRIQEFDMKEIDCKITSLIDELQVSNSEKNKYKLELTELKRINTTLEESTKKNKEKYLRMKMNTEAYERNIKQLEKELQKLNYDKEVILKENDMTRENIKKNANNKIQMLDDIQSLIKTHKQGLIK